MKIEYQPVNLLILFVILILLQAILQSILLKLRPQQGTQAYKPKTLRPLMPKTEDDCPFCQADKVSPLEKPEIRPTPRPWSEVRSLRGRKKTISTQGRACNNPVLFIIASSMSAFTPWWGMGATASMRRYRI
jgi:hypothetical protein